MISAKVVKLVIAASVFVLLLTLWFRGCEQPPVPLTSNNDLFAVTMPAGWLVKPGLGVLVAIAPLPDDAGADRPDITVAISRVDDPQPVDEYLKQHVAMIQRAMADVAVGPITQTTLSGEPAAMLTFTHTVRARAPQPTHDADNNTPTMTTESSTELPTQVRQAWVIGMIHEDQYFSIVCSGAAATFESHRSTFEQVIESFKLKPANMRGRLR